MSNPLLSMQIPELWSEEKEVGGSRYRQLLTPAFTIAPLRAEETSTLALPAGREARLLPSGTEADGPSLGLRISDLEEGSATWVNTAPPDEPAEVLESLLGEFRFPDAQAAMEPTDGTLRPPQWGALHAVTAHWTASPNEPATVVMPTGTGKTEAMLALFAHSRPNRLLVIVPLKLLRAQIAGKFESLGLLRRLGVISNAVRNPVVGIVTKGFKDIEAARRFARCCNVIVAIPATLTRTGEATLRGITDECSHLFIDEAHHAPASTWSLIRDQFEDKRVVQFTATPYRRDGRRMGGTIVYNYPLERAFDAGFFQTIRYQPVVAHRDQDEMLAAKAVEVLRRDLAQGLKHTLLARTGTKAEAEGLLPIYQELAPDLSPVVIHSGKGTVDRRNTLDGIRDLQHRIVICVDMFGEGFDFPNLKVAALHRPHRSLGPTMQFVGRFARPGTGVGAATVVVARPEPGYDPRLRQLFAEDPDWNAIITELNTAEIGDLEAEGAFDSGFYPRQPEIAPQSLEPRMSTVVFTTADATWTPAGVHEVYPSDLLATKDIVINASERVLWFVTRRTLANPWAIKGTADDTRHDLFVIHHDAARRLLYIHSSDKSKVHKDLAGEVCPGARLITGEPVFRAMHGIRRPVPVNVGVLDVRSRSRRFSLHAGSNVSEGFSEAEASTKTQTNVFIMGYQAGERCTMGVSLKGRIWSYKAAKSFKQWVDWCTTVGPKLVDDSVEPQHIKDSFIRPTLLAERPPLVPLALDWPEDARTSFSQSLTVRWDSHEFPLVDCDLELDGHEIEGDIRFSIRSPEAESQYLVLFGEEGMRVSPLDCRAELIQRNRIGPLAEFLEEAGVTVFCARDSVIEPPGVLLQPRRNLDPFPVDRLSAVDWNGINIRKESRGRLPHLDSVQHRAYERLRGTRDWDLIIDDDASGEVADLVAIRADSRTLTVALVHCKSSSEASPGARVNDFYALCGQAQKSVGWRRDVERMFRVLRRHLRDSDTRGTGGFLVGSLDRLYELEDQAPLLQPKFELVVVQPGLSKQAVSEAVLELLASTEAYVRETGDADFTVWCSP